jgi:hypothetical protein
MPKAQNLSPAQIAAAKIEIANRNLRNGDISGWRKNMRVAARHDVVLSVRTAIAHLEDEQTPISYEQDMTTFIAHRVASIFEKDQELGRSALLVANRHAGTNRGVIRMIREQAARIGMQPR